MRSTLRRTEAKNRPLVKGGDIVNLIVHRYEGNMTRWKGYVEPEDRSWIIYFDENGRPAAYFAQREESGAVVNDSFVELS